MSHFAQFQPLIADATDFAGTPLPTALRMSQEGTLETFYAPLDYINPQARVVICGITPGLQQATRALQEAQLQLRAGTAVEQARKLAKQTASFAGAMRSNLIALLDAIGLQQHLGIDSCASLFASHSHLVHYTSALRYPVFIKGENYSGTPSMLKRPTLRQQIDQHLSEEVRQLGTDCVYVPLGPKVTEVFEYLQQQGLLRSEQILNGLPHPSGANAERISYFLGRKSRDTLSSKTNPAALDAARTRLLDKMQQLQSRGSKA